MTKDKNSLADPGIHHLARLYLKPTNRCNLECRTCMRHGCRWSQGFIECP